MNIYGIGIDILEIKRIKKLKKKTIKKLSKKILTNLEYKKYKKNKKKKYFLAKKFVAKEAVSKALGIGIKNGTILNCIEIFNNSNGKPKVKLINKKNIFKKEKIKKIHISITDEKKYAQAFVIIEK